MKIFFLPRLLKRKASFDRAVNDPSGRRSANRPADGEARIPERLTPNAQRLLSCLLPTAYCLLLAPVAAQQPKAPRPMGDPVRCANLIYAGNKTSQCFSDRFLLRMQQETNVATEPRFHKVRLDSRDLTRYPFAIMTGEGAFTLTEKERLQLRHYVTHGGFLLASAGCSDPQWIRAFRAEFTRLFPGKSLTRLSLDHPIFRLIYRIESLETRKHLQRTAGVGLEALTLNGRIVLLFSPDGLNDTEHAENCCCCFGDEIARAELINVNILTYALLH